MNTTRLLLVRHGATQLTSEDRFSGAGGVDLSDEGRAQVERLAARLAGGPGERAIAAVFCSPLSRTVETAAILAAPLRLTPIHRDGLREIDHGHWEGLARQDVEARFPDEYKSWEADPFTFAPERGESGVAVLARALPVIREIVVTHAGEQVIVVSHKATLRLLLSSLLGFDARGYRDRLDQSPACLNVLDFKDPVRARLMLFNDVSHYQDRPRRSQGNLSKWWDPHDELMRGAGAAGGGSGSSGKNGGGDGGGSGGGGSGVTGGAEWRNGEMSPPARASVSVPAPAAEGGRRPPRFRLTLPRFFALVVGALALLAGLVLVLAVRTAGQGVVRTGETARMRSAAQVAGAVEADLGVAARAVEDFEQGLAAGVVDDRDPVSVQRYLTTEFIALRSLTELTLTTATLVRYQDDDDADNGGAAVLAAKGRRQISIFRDSRGAIGHRVLAGFAPDGASDPTTHDTFRGAARRDERGQALWSDLAYSEADAALPADQRRKTMTVQKAIFTSGAGDADSKTATKLTITLTAAKPTTKTERFVGVLRAGIVSDTLDHIGAPSMAMAMGPSAGSDDGRGGRTRDARWLFICDTAGRLVTRLSPADRYAPLDDAGAPDPDGDLRVVPAALPPPVAAALAFERAGRERAPRMVVGGTPYFFTLVPVAEGQAQGWLVGLVVPESEYVGDLAAARDRLLALLVAVVLVIAAVGLLGARTIGRGLRALVGSTDAMRRFSFQPTADAVAASPFGEIRGALESVERAKTALRAMVKYVPIDLVRRLYHSGRDPVLGADLLDVSLMFTDIADFTTHAESLPPDRLAAVLGRYLEAATRAVESAGGTVDKYIGDALMVLWNAPEPVANHAAAACRGALACAAATRELGASAWWQTAGLPLWRTRFGLHTDRVLVGNFGAPERLSYTAMGDGVNLAARLEGLNKLYGTTILVSAEVRAQAGDAFLFRQIDRVAVKGKSRAVAVFELLGEAGDPAAEARRAAFAPYEAALAATLDRQFARALDLLSPLPPSDGATAMLTARCRAWLTTPPPADWDGTWIATSK